MFPATVTYMLATLKVRSSHDVPDVLPAWQILRLLAKKSKHMHLEWVEMQCNAIQTIIALRSQSKLMEDLGRDAAERYKKDTAMGLLTQMTTMNRTMHDLGNAMALYLEKTGAADSQVQRGTLDEILDLDASKAFHDFVNTETLQDSLGYASAQQSEMLKIVAMELGSATEKIGSEENSWKKAILWEDDDKIDEVLKVASSAFGKLSGKTVKQAIQRAEKDCCCLMFPVHYT